MREGPGSGDGAAVDLVPLGGLGEIGLNLLLLECRGRILVVDCGLMFPDEGQPGVDVVIPDFAALAGRAGDIAGVVLTHGHEDHVGALPWFLARFPVPVHGTPFTLALVREKLREHRLDETAKLVPFHPGERLALGPFSVETIPVAHSIPGGVALAIDTPAGLVVHSGDFKLDPDPVDGRRTDLDRLAALGGRGVALLLADSTNAGRPGTTPSERSILPALREIVTAAPGRVVAATFASHVHRLQQILDVAAEAGRHVHLSGRSLVSVAGTAAAMGELRLPSPLLVDARALAALPPERVLVCTTGSQGEPLAALSRIAAGEHKHLEILPGDRVILSARVIPGHEKAVARTVNRLVLRGAEVYQGRDAGVHVSGHAAQRELLALLAAVRPRTLVPIHGEPRQLAHHARLAAASGPPATEVLLATNGARIRLEDGRASLVGAERAGRVLVDGSGLGDEQDPVLRERGRLGEDGIVVCVVPLVRGTGALAAAPEVVARGVAFAGEEAGLLAEAREAAAAALAGLGPDLRAAWAEVEPQLRRALRRVADRRLARRPLVHAAAIEV